MNPFLSALHQELRRARLTRRGATQPAEGVPTGQHHTFARFPRITLPETSSPSLTLASALKSRSSARVGNPDVPFSIHELASLFGHALRARPDGSRNYPSGGALYPIETYLIATALEGEPSGVFHYDPSDHALERLLTLPKVFDMKTIAQRPESLPLSALIVFTSVWDRSSAKYGDLSYLHAILEAGHMSENILLMATALGIHARPYAGFNDDLIEELLDLESYSEQAVHSITLSKGDSREEPMKN